MQSEDNNSLVSVLTEPPAPIKNPKGAGRPRKEVVQAKKNRGKVGRPAGDSARIAEFKARLLSTKGDAVIRKILDTALEDGHPAQSACMKMVIDRALPVSLFEKGAGKSNQIQINITTAGPVGVTNEVTPDEDEGIIDVDFTEVSDDEE